MRHGLICVGLLLALPACSAADSSTEPQAKKDVSETLAAPREPVTLTVTPTATDGSLLVEGTINLPDGALVTVLVSRTARFDSGARNFHAGGDGVSVTDGAFSTEIQPDEAMLLDAIEDESIFGPVEAVADSLVVCAQVRTNDENEQPQSDEVMDVLGEDGSHLKSSPQRSRFGDGWRLEALATTMLPNEDVASLGGAVQHEGNLGEPFCA